MGSRRPIIRLFVTATPVPALLALHEEEEVDDIKFWSIEPCDDYIGQDQMFPLQDDHGKFIFLKQGELKYSEGVSFGKTYIPYTNKLTMQMYDAAAESKKKGILLIDITDVRVNVAGNVTEKAELVQQYENEKDDDSPSSLLLDQASDTTIPDRNGSIAR